MGDAESSSHLELPPSTGTFTPGTPSGLTPNTRSEAEAALTLNSAVQTDSAAPTATFLLNEDLAMGGDKTVDVNGMTEAQRAWRRPAGPIRTSSTNYEKALAQAHQDPSLQSILSTDTMTVSGRDITGQTVASPTSATSTTFPPPGQGVVPLHTGVGSGQAEAIRKAKPTGLSLGELGRKQSWNAQDFKHVYSANLMEPVKSDDGYASGAEGPRPGEGHF